MKARALVVQNGRSGGPRRLESWLAEHDVAVDVRHPYLGEALPTTLEHDALIMLGGGYLPDDDARAPWLAPVRALVDGALEAGTPYLGICLGGQLLAHVGGGEVRGEHGTPEFGSTALTLRPEAAHDPLFADVPADPTAIEHHVDAITRLPDDAVWLASSQACPYQAFRLGDKAWGLQFHPETTPDRINTWSQASLDRHGLDREQLHAAAVQDDARAAAIWRQFTLRFAARVTGS